MEIKKMTLGSATTEVYPFCRSFGDGVMLGLRQGLYIFNKDDTIRQTGFPDARESWLVAKGVSEFNQFIDKAISLGEFEISNKWVPSLLALSYVVEALGIYGDALDEILNSDALTIFISTVFPTVSFDVKLVVSAFTQNQLPSDRPLYEYRRDKVRCGLNNWGVLRFSERHVGFQYEVAEETQTIELVWSGEPCLGGDGLEEITRNEWMTFLWKRLYIMVLWRVGIYTDDISFKKGENLVVDFFKYRSPVGVVPITHVRYREELEDALDDRLMFY